MNERIRQTVAWFSTMKIVVVGDVMLDLYEYCYTDRSKPIDSEKPGRRAYTAQAVHRSPGGAGNVAANLASLSVTTVLIGVAGNDGHNLTLQQLCERRGIRARFIRDPARQTTTKNRLYLDDEYLLRRDDECTDPIPETVGLSLFNEVLCELDGADAVVLSDYAKGVFSETLAQEIITVCHTRSLPVIVDFKPAHRVFFRGASIIAPNAGEAESLLPSKRFSSPTDDTLECNARRLHALLDCRNLIVTLGEHGLCGTDGKTFFHVPSHRVQVVDAVGCGDTVRAVLALGHAAGLDLREAAELANRAAGMVIRKTGTATLTREELLAYP
ncbi:MAG: bifunctional hydroxymethylpyrimidine kinase/phosphomethylpyrimidine kinase [candidate division Zixibacteria bacterium]|nr:bifunctional hydroxymethylpyrimidine kinase/phosphomethylpyrimidine kinase [candidate division Zixibacteria bacterium]